MYSIILMMTKATDLIIMLVIGIFVAALVVLFIQSNRDMANAEYLVKTPERTYTTKDILYHNNCVSFDDKAVCGTYTVERINQ